MRKRTIPLLLALTLGTIPVIASCNSTEGGGEQEEYHGDYDIRLVAIGQTTIKASKTVQLRASVTGTTEKDVIFTSSDEKIATVNEKGLVTGISKGKAIITCSLKIEPKCKKTIEITVEESALPTKLEITGYGDLTQWVGQAVDLTVEVTPAEASSLVEWSTSDATVATITEAGHVEFLKEGNVTISVKSKEAQNVKSSVDFRVKKGTFRSDLGSPYWDISKQADDTNPNVKLNIDTAKLGYHSLYFANFKGTRYYVEGSFKVDAQISPWVWQGFGFGSGLSETSTRYFIFSPRVDGQGNDFNKFIVKDLPNETWPALTTRSQTWGENGLDNIDWRNNEVKVALLRDNNTYYYLLNDKLMYVDESTVYDEIPTMPILVSIDLPVTVKNYKLITEDAQIDAKLSEQQFKYSFYPSNEERVEYQSDSRFIFKSNNILSKDNKVKSLGDKAKLVGDFEVEFDIEDMLCNKAHTNGFSGIGLNLSRYDSADTVESFLVGNSVLEGKIENTARYNSWNYTMSYDNENSSYYYLESSTQLFENPKTSHHVKVTRTIENNISTFKMFVDETEVNFDLKSSKFEGMTSKYTGAYILWIAGEYASGEVNNLTFKSAINKGGN